MRKHLVSLLLAGVSLAAVAAGFDVKVTGGKKDGIRYYVTYEINGVKYRSDEAPVRVNQIAWSHMSDADKKLTVEYVYGVWNARAKQFGVDFSAEMAKWYDTGLGWTEAVEVLKSRLVEKLYPGLPARLSKANRAEYFEKNFSPTHYMEGDESVYCHPPYEPYLYDELKYWQNLACAAYDTLENAAYIRVSAAVKTTSGDLIQLITDRCLVPNITPAGTGGTLASAIGVALDYLNNMSHAQDELTGAIVGERATASAAVKIIEIADVAMERNAAFIKECLEHAHDVQNEISAKCQAYGEATYAREEAINRERLELQSDYDRFRVSGLEEAAKANRDIISARNTYAKAAEDAYDSYRWACWKYDEASKAVAEEGTPAAKEEQSKYLAMIAPRLAAWRAALKIYDEYLVSTIKDVQSRYNNWRLEYYGDPEYQSGISILGGKVAALREKGAAILASLPESPQKEIEAMFGKTDNFCVTSEEVDALMNTVNKYVAARKAYLKKFYDFTQEVFALANEMYASALPILKDLRAIAGCEGQDENGLIWKIWPVEIGRLEDLIDVIWSPIFLINPFDSCYYCTDDRIDADVEFEQAIIEKYTNYQGALAKYEEVYNTITSKFNAEKVGCRAALENLRESLALAQSAEEALPTFIREETYDHGVLNVNPNTELGRTFLGGEGTCEQAFQYKQTLDALDQDMNDKLTAVDFNSLDVQLRDSMSQAYAQLACDTVNIAARNIHQSDAARVMDDALALSVECYGEENSYRPGDDVKKLILLQRDFNNRGLSHVALAEIYGTILSNEGKYSGAINGKTGSQYDQLMDLIRRYSNSRRGSDVMSPVQRDLLFAADDTITFVDYEGIGEDPEWTTYTYDNPWYLIYGQSYTMHVEGYAEYLADKKGEKDVYRDLLEPLISKIDSARSALPRVTALFLPNNEDYDPWSSGGWSFERAKGQALEEMPGLICAGYTFDGWWTDPEAGERVTEETVITDDTTYYAHWIPESFTVVLHKNDGTATEKVLSAEWRSDTFLPGAAKDLKWAPRRGFKFMGWSLEEKSKVVRFGDKANVKKAAPENSTLDLYAIWQLDTAKSYAIQYIRNDGSGMVRTVGFNYGDPQKLNSVTALGFARRGYTFVGWATSTEDARNKKVWKPDMGMVSTAAEPGKLLKIYAIWTLTPGYYTIRFNKNDGSGAWRELGYEYGKNTTLPTIENGLGWGRPGYTFVGWRTKSEIDKGGTKIWLKDKGVTKTPIAAGKTLSIYAIWEPVSYGSAVCTGEGCSGGGETPVPVVKAVQAIAYFADGDSQTVEARIESDGFTVVELGGSAYCGYVSDGVGELLGPDGSMLLVVTAVD